MLALVIDKVGDFAVVLVARDVARVNGHVVTESEMVKVLVQDLEWQHFTIAGFLLTWYIWSGCVTDIYM